MCTALDQIWSFSPLTLHIRIQQKYKMLTHSINTLHVNSITDEMLNSNRWKERWTYVHTHATEPNTSELCTGSFFFLFSWKTALVYIMFLFYKYIIRLPFRSFTFTCLNVYSTHNGFFYRFSILCFSFLISPYNWFFVKCPRERSVKMRKDMGWFGNEIKIR